MTGILPDWKINRRKQMRSRFALSFLMIVTAGNVLAQDIESEKGKLSYAVGWDIGKDIKRRSSDFDVESLIAAIRDTVADREPQVANEEMQALMTALQQKVREEQLAAFQALAAENQAASQAFLESNKTKTGIVVMPSGVQYRVIEEGEGSRPTMESTVRVHYRGSKMDGREFDSSFARGVPEQFGVNAVLQGWQEVLPLMKQGATWQIFVPPELAFGERGNAPVGPNEALMFDLKLVEIVQ
ncbi:MAG: FKBP-type peptidyl-prolyl cis-trans isomerase FklB [Lysobacterales bacterium]|jgi:FKBP-type peptidyl-prolyl cis-trans isomerase FklB